MNEITITAKDFLLVASAMGPSLIAALGLWNRMSRWQTTMSLAIDSLQIDLGRVETDRKEREAEARAQADETHRSMSQIQSEIGKVRESLGFLRGQNNLSGEKR